MEKIRRRKEAAGLSFSIFDINARVLTLNHSWLLGQKNKFVHILRFLAYKVEW